MTAFAPAMSPVQTIALAHPMSPLLPDELAEIVCESFGIAWDSELEVKLTATPLGVCEECSLPAVARVEWSQPKGCYRATDIDPAGWMSEDEHTDLRCHECLPKTVEATLFTYPRISGVRLVVTA